MVHIVLPCHVLLQCRRCCYNLLQLCDKVRSYLASAKVPVPEQEQLQKEGLELSVKAARKNS